MDSLINGVVSLLGTDLVPALLLYTLICLVALWLVFCVWVFLDAKKRFKKTVTAVFFTLMILLFNFPALILYLIIRPEESLSDILLLPENTSGGVNVPIANFIDKDGTLDFSIQLKINQKSSPNIEGEPKLNLNLDIENDDKDSLNVRSIPVQIKSEKVQLKEEPVQTTAKKERKFFTNNLKANGKKFFSNAKLIGKKLKNKLGNKTALQEKEGNPPVKQESVGSSEASKAETKL